MVVYPGMQAALILMHEQGAQMAGAPSQEQLLMNFDVAGVWDIRRQSFESSQPMLEQPQIPIRTLAPQRAAHKDVLHIDVVPISMVRGDRLSDLLLKRRRDTFIGIDE